MQRGGNTVELRPNMQPTLNRLSNKKALVTGGSRGIGAVIVNRFAQERADVAFTFRGRRDAAEKVSANIEKSGVRSMVIQVDSGCSLAAIRGRSGVRLFIWLGIWSAMYGTGLLARSPAVVAALPHSFQISVPYVNTLKPIPDRGCCIFCLLGIKPG
jgi:hypothetical protein